MSLFFKVLSQSSVGLRKSENAWKSARFMDRISNPWPIHSKCHVKSTPSGRILVTGTWCTPPNGASKVLNHTKAMLDQDTRLGNFWPLWCDGRS